MNDKIGELDPGTFGYTLVGQTEHPVAPKVGKITTPTVHHDARGWLVELFRQSTFDKGADAAVKQIYISATEPDVVKGWHLHLQQTDRFVCIRGRVLVCTFDLLDEAAKVEERILDARKPEVMEIPPWTAHGWVILGNEESWILNMVSEEYTGLDEWRRNPRTGPRVGIDFDWRRSRDG